MCAKTIHHFSYFHTISYMLLMDQGIAPLFIIKRYDHRLRVTLNAHVCPSHAMNFNYKQSLLEKSILERVEIRH